MVPSFFFHFLDVALCNAWLVYRRDLDQVDPAAKPLSLYEFKAVVSECLRKQHQPISSAHRVGRPPTPRDDPARELYGTRRRRPAEEVIHDHTDHFPGSHPKRQRCKNLPCTGKTTVFCLKCKLHLCLSTERNCFCEFHGVHPADFD